MAWQSKPIYVGSHIWLAQIGAAFLSPAAGVVSQMGQWPDPADPGWPNWAMGVVESLDVDPKMASSEIILAPTPGAVQALDEISPYAVPEISFTCLYTDALAEQLAYNTQPLANGMNEQFAPNGGGGPGVLGIIKCQKYDQNNNLLINWQSWAFIKLKSALKHAPKTMTKPEYTATLLYSPNNYGTI